VPSANGCNARGKEAQGRQTEVLLAGADVEEEGRNEWYGIQGRPSEQFAEASTHFGKRIGERAHISRVSEVATIGLRSKRLQGQNAPTSSACSIEGGGA